MKSREKEINEFLKDINETIAEIDEIVDEILKEIDDILKEIDQTLKEINTLKKHKKEEDTIIHEMSILYCPRNHRLRLRNNQRTHCEICNRNENQLYHCETCDKYSCIRCAQNFNSGRNLTF